MNQKQRKNHRLVLSACITFGLMLGIGSSALGQVDAELLRKAKAGDAVAQVILGVMYDDGDGVPENDAEAVKWYRKAADQGFAPGQVALGVMFLLGGMYDDGEGVPENYVLAHMWLNLARAQGLANAKTALDLLIPKMTNAQIAEAQRMAAEWHEKHSSSTAD